MIGYAPPVTSTYVALCFFFNDTATTEIYTLSLHDALPICTTSRQATEALGIKPGHTVTMPKRFVRLAGTRATGRSFDDRVGDAALLLALRHLDRAAVKHQVIFIWSTREEIGLEGAQGAAAILGTTPRRVHAVDTFVSADSPLELANFAVAPLGQGAAARAL